MNLEQGDNQALLASLTGPSAAKALVEQYDSLTNLAQASFDELRGIPGIGMSRAKAIRSAFLLAQRLSQEKYQDCPTIDTPERVADLLREDNRLYTVEHLQVVMLNTRRRLIAVRHISQGTLDSLLISPREIFIHAIQGRAAAVILAHNHPSGDPQPSEADIRITRELVRAGHLLKIEVLDHIILGHRTESRPRDFVSMRELGHCFGG